MHGAQDVLRFFAGGLKGVWTDGIIGRTDVHKKGMEMKRVSILDGCVII